MYNACILLIGLFKQPVLATMRWRIGTANRNILSIFFCSFIGLEPFIYKRAAVIFKKLVKLFKIF